MANPRVSLTTAERGWLDEPPQVVLNKSPIRSERVGPYTLRQLKAMPELMMGPPEVIPNLAWSGRVTLLSAQPKQGKSTLLGQAVSALSAGTEFLGEPLTPARTLWYALDEALSDAVRRFDRFGANVDAVAVCEEVPSAAEMADEAHAVGANLIVVDTLSELLRGTRRNDPGEVSTFLRPYIDVARDLNSSLLLVHHTRKGGDVYSGTVAFAASVDVPLMLTGNSASADDAPDLGVRKLCGTGRGVRVSIPLSFDGVRYTRGDSPIPLRMRILSLLATQPCSANRLREQLGARRGDVLEILHTLEDEKAVETEGRKNSPNRCYRLVVPHEAKTFADASEPVGEEYGN